MTICHTIIYVEYVDYDEYVEYARYTDYDFWGAASPPLNPVTICTHFGC